MTAARVRFTRPGVLVAVLLLGFAACSAPNATSPGSTAPHGSTMPTTTPTTTRPTPPEVAALTAGTVVAPSRLWSISFADPIDGAGLFSVTSTSGSAGTQLAVTRDGGRRWAAIGKLLPLPDDETDASAGIAEVSTSISWSSSTQGYAWDATMFMRTSDGGRHWTRVPFPRLLGLPRLTAVSVFSGQAWVGFDCGRATVTEECTNPLWSWSTAAGWMAVPLPATGWPIVEIVRPSSSEALVLGMGPSGLLLVSDDGGSTWSRRSLPCSSLANRGPSVVVPTPSPASIVSVGGTLVLECVSVGGVGGGYQPMSFWSRSADSATWQLQSDNVTRQGSPRVGIAPRGYGAPLSMTPGTVWMPAGRGGLWRSKGDGRVWTQVPALKPTTSAGGGFVYFVDGMHGWCLYYPYGVWSTSDGGMSWRLEAEA